LTINRIIAGINLIFFKISETWVLNDEVEMAEAEAQLVSSAAIQPLI